MRAFYDSFETFTKDQELLVSMPELVDYVEGFVVLNEHSLRSSSVAFPAEVDFSPDFASGAGSNNVHYYCIEFAVHDFQQQDSAADHVSLSPATYHSYQQQQPVALASSTVNRAKGHC